MQTNFSRRKPAINSALFGLGLGTFSFCNLLPARGVKEIKFLKGDVFLQVSKFQSSIFITKNCSR